MNLNEDRGFSFILDFISGLTLKLEKYGRSGAIASILLGLSFIYGGWVLTFKIVQNLIMLTLCGLGVGMVFVGLGYFFGPQAKVRRAMGAEPPRRPGSTPARVTESSLPFWICLECKIAREGVSTADRCMECGSVTDYLEVHDEKGRRSAATMLASP